MESPFSARITLVEQPVQIPLQPAATWKTLEIALNLRLLLIKIMFTLHRCDLRKMRWSSSDASEWDLKRESAMTHRWVKHHFF